MFIPKEQRIEITLIFQQMEEYYTVSLDNVYTVNPHFKERWLDYKKVLDDLMLDEINSQIGDEWVVDFGQDSEYTAELSARIYVHKHGQFEIIVSIIKRLMPSHIPITSFTPIAFNDHKTQLPLSH